LKTAKNAESSCGKRYEKLSVADRYRTALQSISNLKLVDFDVNIGFMAGSLRARYGLPLPDMFQAAVALSLPARTLVSNDKALKRIEEIDVILLSEIGPLQK
jgi:predicted nucleic acid-binding protein